MAGKLYLCPTPIGNLEDISYRVLKTLKSVDFIAAEDTRHTLKLLNHFEIKKKMISYHEHNKIQSGLNIVNLLTEGHDIAIVTDAGMPCISDPGEDLVKLCIDHSIELEALPGPSAVVTALAASGLSTRRFLFEGFLDKKKKARNLRIEALKSFRETMIFYESPHRLLDTLKVFLDIFGDRRIVIAREITKRYEEYYRDSISSSIEYFEKKGVKGEFVLLIEGNQIEEIETFDMSIEEHLSLLIDQGISKKDAITEVAKIRQIPKKEVYNISINLKK